MSDTIRETSPMITPDTLRKINKMNQAFYETHTKKNFGKTDVYGSQYSGTVENFGFEMLLEARKQKMEKPSLEGVFEINNYKYYFDLQYSNMIETYEQQGMLEAVLKKDVFLSNKEYRLKFSNCEDVYIPRSESWGNLNDATPSKVFKNKFIYTRTAPKLIIKDLSSGVIEEIDLKLEVAEDFEADYYFYHEFATEKFIDTYAGGDLVTVPITNDDAGLSFVWICEEIFKSLPPVDFVGNEPISGKPILTIGVDGQDVSHIYPIIYGIGSLPTQPSPGQWFLKAFSELDGFIPTNDNNYNAKISSIYYSFRPEDNSGDIDYEISFEEDYIKITLSDVIEWGIVRDTLNSEYHAEVSIDDFSDNTDPSPNIVLKQAFDISFSDNYLFDPYEGLCEEAESGVHIDILSDYSENSVPKKNGIIHSLGEFDGLPSYFKSFHDRIIHRSHVELYSIRDRLNRHVQTPMSKQTVALLLDSAIPKDELKGMTNDQEPAIIYQYDPEKYLYVTNSDKVISKKNVVSELTYVDDSTIGNCKIPAYAKKKKFIYHGNRTFSLETLEFDSEIETARVYYINNDSISYVNNASVPDEKKKAPLTLARICDIPTQYEQLMHVDNVSATYIFDRNYVRSEAGMTDDDKDLLLNKRRFCVALTPDTGSNGDVWLYSYRNGLPTKQTLMDAGYYVTVNLHNTDTPITTSNFNILAGGNGYDVGDTFYCLVGGKAYDGVVTEVVLGGYVHSVDITVESDSVVSYYNIDGEDTPLKTVTVSSEHGDGNLQIQLTIPESQRAGHAPIVIDAYSPSPSQYNLVAFMNDAFGNIFMYELQHDWTWNKICQVEGEEYRTNEYDVADGRMLDRSFEYSFFKYLLSNPTYANDESIFYNPMDYVVEESISDYQPARGHKGDTETTDLSEYIVRMNNPNSYYVLDCYDNTDNGHFNLYTYEQTSPDGYEVTLPRFNTNNTLEHYNVTNRLEIMYSNLNVAQPTLFVYSPSHNTRIIDSAITGLTDTILVTNSRFTNYNDYCSNIMETSGKLKWNVYYYPEYEFSDSYNGMLAQLRTMQRSELITYIRDMLGSDSEPFKYEDTEYRYSYDELIKYIMERYPTDGPYLKSGLRIHGYAGDQSIDNYGNPLGKQPTGGMIPVTADVINVNVTVDGSKKTSEPINIFIIDDQSFSGFDDDFKVHNEYGNDITSTAIILWEGYKYIYRDGRWMQLSKQVVDGYYNITNRMFYYDSQYANMITPDPDIIYCDINTGQYYKWNGSNYVLIIYNEEE